MVLPNFDVCVCVFVLNSKHNFFIYQDVVLEMYYEATWKTNSFSSGDIDQKQTFCFTIKTTRKTCNARDNSLCFFFNYWNVSFIKETENKAQKGKVLCHNLSRKNLNYQGQFQIFKCCWEDNSEFFFWRFRTLNVSKLLK